MKKQLTFPLLVLLLTASNLAFSQRKNEATPTTPSSASIPEQAFVSADVYDGFIPQTPVIYTGSLPVWGAKEGANNKESMLALVGQQAKLKTLLPDFTIDYYIRKVGNDGKSYYGISGVTGEAGNYEITYDITKSTTVPLSEVQAGSNLSTYIRVGVGMRIKASITTTQAGVDVSNLDHLAMAASKDQLRGGLSFLLFGIDGPSVIAMSPNSNARIDASAIDTFMQSVAILKSRMYDESVTLVPRIFSVQKGTLVLPGNVVGSTN